MQNRVTTKPEVETLEGGDKRLTLIVMVDGVPISPHLVVASDRPHVIEALVNGDITLDRLVKGERPSKKKFATTHI